MSVAIVGTGAVGTALAHAFVAAGIRVAAVANRHDRGAVDLAAALPGRTRALAIGQVGTAAPIVLVAVSDSAIEDACAALRPSPGTMVAHTSGSRDATALAAVRAHGALVGAFHPLAAVARGPQAYPSPDAYPALFRGAVFAIEGDDAVQRALAPLAVALGGFPFAIQPSDKPLYHLGASMLAAFAAGLADLAWDELRRAGASPALASAGVGHLLATVARNVAASPRPAAVLTGPVARGDAAGVQRQAQTAHRLSPAAAALYREHARHTLAIVRAEGRMDEATADAVARALGEG